MTISIHRWTASDEVELVWHEAGAGRPVILLHGLISSAEMNWIKFGHAERLAAAGCRAIMPDLRAHGASGKPHDAALYPPGVLVRDLEQLVARLGLSEFDLGGFSLGARVAAQAVVGGMAPRRLILGGMGLTGLTGWERRKSFFRTAIDEADSAEHGDPHWLAVQFMKTMKVDRVAMSLLLDSITDLDRGDLARLTMPALLVCGVDDSDNGSAAELAAALPDARLVEIPGTHMSSVTRRELGEAIATFVLGDRLGAG